MRCSTVDLRYKTSEGRTRRNQLQRGHNACEKTDRWERALEPWPDAVGPVEGLVDSPSDWITELGRPSNQLQRGFNAYDKTGR